MLWSDENLASAICHLLSSDGYSDRKGTPGIPVCTLRDCKTWVGFLQLCSSREWSQFLRNDRRFRASSQIERYNRRSGEVFLVLWRLKYCTFARRPPFSPYRCWSVKFVSPFVLGEFVCKCMYAYGLSSVLDYMMMQPTPQQQVFSSSGGDDDDDDDDGGGDGSWAVAAAARSSSLLCAGEGGAERSSLALATG